MSMYKGRLWLVPNRDSKLRVEIHLDSESIKITSNETLIGDWPISEVELREVGNNTLRLCVEGEEVVVSSRDPQFMPSLLGPLGDGRHVAARRKRSSFNGPPQSTDQQHEGFEQASAVGSSEQPSAIARNEEFPVEEPRSRRGAYRSARPHLWRSDPSTR